MERVRLGVVGAGNIAVMNVRGYLEDPRCDVVAVCDTDEAVGRQAAKDWGDATYYADLTQMLADDSIDAVEILTPTFLHHDHVIAALEAGKHVSVQKPIANSVDDGLAMEAAAEKAGRTLRVSECFVHYPPLELAKRLVADGAIGKPTSLRIRTLVGQTDSAFQAGLRPEGYGWRLDKRSAGGHLFDDMVHKYAMALWLLDQDITSVQAVVRRRDLFFEPCAVIFEYENPDILGMMEVQYAPNFYMRSSYYGADEFFEITGDEGQIWVTRATGEMLDLAPVMLFTGTPTERKTTEFTDLDADWGTGFVRSSQHFIDALLEGEAGRHDGGRGHRRPPPLLRRLPGGGVAQPGRSAHHHRAWSARRAGGTGSPGGDHSLPGRRPHVDAGQRRAHRAEALVSGRPLAPGLGHLVAAAGHEVPPHQEGLGEGDAAEQQGAGRRANVEPALVPSLTEIGQQPRFGHLVPDGHRAFEHDEGVLALGPQRQHGARRRQDEVDAQVVRVAPGRRLHAAEDADEHGAPQRRRSSTSGSSAWCSKAAGPCRVDSGWATQSWMPCELAPEAPGVLLGVGHAVAGRHEVELAGLARPAPNPGCRGGAARPRRAR